MKKILFLCLLALTVVLTGVTVFAAETTLPTMGINVGSSDNPTDVVNTLQIIFLLALITLLPSLLIVLTCFTRIIIVMHFLRSALGTQQMPPNQILIGLSLFLTLFLMGPTLQTINDKALAPYSAGQISQQEAMTNAMEPIRGFMLKQVNNKDLALFVELSGESLSVNDPIPTRVLIPAYILGELTKGFQIGFILFLPFIVIDMIVASVLMAMGMMMLPPAMISLPFKILLFVMVDGWSLVIENLIKTFKMV